MFKEPYLDPTAGSSQTKRKAWSNPARGPKGWVSMSCLRSVTDPAQRSKSGSYSNPTKSK